MQEMQEMQECKNARMDGRTRLKRVASALVHSCILCICAFLVSSCASAQAKGAAAGPPLDVPAPPSRVVEPIVAEVPQPLPLPEDPRPAHFGVAALIETGQCDLRSLVGAQLAAVLPARLWLSGNNGDGRTILPASRIRLSQKMSRAL